MFVYLLFAFMLLFISLFLAVCKRFFVLFEVKLDKMYIAVIGNSLILEISALGFIYSFTFTL